MSTRKQTVVWMARVGAAIAVLTLLLGAVQPEQKPTNVAATGGEPGLDTAAIPVDGLGDRLASLLPDDPAAYFRLAEEVAAESWAPGAERLARRLYVLTLELNASLPAAGRSPTLGASACLGLATLAENEEERRWLHAVAGRLDDGESVDAAVERAPITDEDPAYELASALGLVRAGYGRRASRLLERPGVSELLARYERLLSPLGFDGGVERMMQRIAVWPVCPECRNRRIVTEVTRGEVTRQVCPVCRGNPGPRIDEQELVLQLRLESLLLRGIHRSWGAQAMADGGAPLRDPDPAEIARVYGVDPAASVWRDGGWRRPAADPAEPAASTPAEDDAAEERG